MAREWTRRGFLAAGGAAALGVVAARRARAELQDVQVGNGIQIRKSPVCVFSKHLQFLGYPELAAACKALGLDGVDLTVREGGHVLPERVAEDLPRAVEAIRAAGLQVAQITTRYTKDEGASTRAVLEAASKANIQYVRIGGHQYDFSQDVLAQLKAVEADLRGLVTLAEEFNLTLGYHNHSGARNVGAPLWDLLRVYEAIASPRLGANLDFGHAMVEGSYGAWEISAHALAPHVKMVAVKDFVWSGAKPKWVPMGEGIVPIASFLRILHEKQLTPPVSIHVEYKVKGDDAMLDAVRTGNTVVRAAMAEAGYA